MEIVKIENGQIEIAKEFTKLQDRTVKIILSRYYDKLTYAEIGEKYNLSKSTRNLTQSP